MVQRGERERGGERGRERARARERERERQRARARARERESERARERVPASEQRVQFGPHSERDFGSFNLEVDPPESLSLV